MSVLPTKDVDQIEFCENHSKPWENNIVVIGISTAQLAAVQSTTTQAREAYTAALEARQASKAATTTLRAKLTAMREAASDVIRTVKATAGSSANPATVYAAAEIPEPLPPTPQPAPGQPTDVVITLEGNGAVTLSWESVGGSASSGAFFNIFRKLPGQGDFVNIGGAPGATSRQRRPSYTDSTVPPSAASAGVQYMIQPQRGTLTGDRSTPVTVQFGVDGVGTMSFNGRTTALRVAA